eukprot:3282338-Alexandrium_andersonii.AAC.1
MDPALQARHGWGAGSPAAPGRVPPGLLAGPAAPHPGVCGRPGAWSGPASRAGPRRCDALPGGPCAPGPPLAGGG